MALSDQWTLSQINQAVRREVMDPTGTTSWSWNDVEINTYINDWQNLLQDRFEFVWSTATVIDSLATTTFTLTSIAANMLRPGNVWYNNFRLKGRDKEELEVMERDWRAVKPSNPTCTYQDDIRTISVWPPPAAGATNTLVFEYPVTTTMSTNTSTMSLPAWTRYSAVNYVVYRMYLRPGPMNDPKRAQRYKQKFIKQGIRIRTIWEQHMPDKAPSLRPGGKYEGDILTVGQHSTLFTTWF